MNKSQMLDFARKHRNFLSTLSGVYNRLYMGNKLYANGVKLLLGLARIKGLKINCQGENNEIIVKDFVRIYHSKITIYGNNNRIIIGNYAYMNQVVLCMEDDCNEIKIGDHTSLCGQAELAVIEGTSIKIGDNCLLSGDLRFRTGDSHSLLDSKGHRINASKSILIGNHVWVGMRVTCLKGVIIQDNSIVAATTTLCKPYLNGNCVIAGVPGRVTKKNVNWDLKRVPITTY